MSFDKPTRNHLAKVIDACRERLAEDVTAQLQSVYGLYSDGTRLDVAQTADERHAAAELRALLDHFESVATESKTRSVDAYQRLVREIGFTGLNRLAALRLGEERGLLIECVRRGMDSDGFRLYDRLANGSLGNRYQTYRAFLEGLYDEMALDLGALFDRRTPHSQVFPSEATLNDVLVLLNDPALTARDIWQHDETIGWIYQYYNDPTERKKMRDASKAPRNSRELAVRNQFFTPRYVVEFLTDNTLGRTWYEMHQGQTRLAEQCRYLVRRANEIWLKKGEQSPAAEGAASEQCQEEQLKKPAYIPFREKKDPRSLKLLDPACGSGHFLLYAFDLFETIYAEAYDDPDLEPDLRASYPDRAEYMRQVPRLILEDNLFGIDIDPRAAQIAALALWLRAQRAYQAMRLAPAERPRITRVNIIIAEPMPGDGVLLDEFIRNLPNTLTSEQHPEIIGPLVSTVFEKMKLAGEAGSLLKIEAELRKAIENGRKAWASQPEVRQLALLPETKQPHQLAMDVSSVTDEAFWRQAEGLTLKALSDYAHQAENGQGTRRRLFAEDAARGFAFIDLCLKQYDVVLMNPPFGDMTKESKPYLERNFPDSRADIYTCFVDRACSWLVFNGRIGVLSNRTFLTLGAHTLFRQKILMSQGQLELTADLGSGVLDAALVEVAAYVVTRKFRPDLSASAVFLPVHASNDKETELGDVLNKQVLIEHPLSYFIDLPNTVFAYWLPPSLTEHFKTGIKLESGAVRVRVGLQTSDDFRFARLRWEIPANNLGTGKHWVFFAKGGEFSPYYDDVHLVVNWNKDGEEIYNFFNSTGDLLSVPRNPTFYFSYGLTYPWRTSLGFAPRVLAADCIFAAQGSAMFPLETSSKPHNDLLSVLGALNSSLFQQFISIGVGAVEGAARSYQVGLVQSLPWKPLPEPLKDKLATLSQSCIRSRQGFDMYDETTVFYCGVPTAKGDLEQGIISLIDTQEDFLRQFIDAYQQIDKLILEIYGIQQSDIASALESVKPSLEARKWEIDSYGSYLLSHLVGVVFGRWDLRIMIYPRLVPKLPDPFSPLPICPPAMLVGPEDLPAMQGRIVSEAWLEAKPDAVTLPTISQHGTVLNTQGETEPATISDEDYPLEIAWDGILVDDPGLGEHPEAQVSDIVRRVETAVAVLWPENYEAVITEISETLAVKDLREYFSRPAGFFADHLKRYSKSRRQAPIYWPLSTASGGYTLWLYYPRLSQEMLYTAVNRYLTPKIGQVEGYIYNLERDLANTFGGAASRLRDQITEMGSFLAELNALRTDLLRVADLPYQPDLNDGVIINAAPLYKLFRLSKWAKDCQATWEKLQAGEYDWAHMAYVLWPERVREKCKSDKSLAIAHGLEGLWQGQEKLAKRKNKRKAAEEDQFVFGLGEDQE